MVNTPKNEFAVYFCVIGRKNQCVNKYADGLATAVTERMHPAVRISSSVCRPQFVKTVVNKYKELMNTKTEQHLLAASTKGISLPGVASVFQGLNSTANISCRANKASSN